MKLLLRWLFTTLAIYAAIQLMPGLSFSGPWRHAAMLALIFGLLNALVRPLLKFLTCPLIVLTLGLFTLVINALMLWLTAAVAERVGIDFKVADFWSAFWGALVISIVSAILNLLISDDERKDE